jgi:hypothetical protein
MKYTKILLTASTFLMMVLLIFLNYNMSAATSFAVFENAPEEAKQAFWSPDRILLVGVIASITVIALFFIVLQEKGLV